jgi:NTP pyrophosphatase (non-canonical NTP hydrolase)
MDLNAYQIKANRTDQRPGKDEGALVFPLIGLASEVGSLVNQFKKRVRDGEAHALFTERVAEELGDVLWYVANLAAKLDLELQDVADLNLRRIAERWPTNGDQPSRLLDDEFEPNEQIPRVVQVDFIQVEEGGRKRVRLHSEGKQLGDPVWDMSWEEDDYRFHDAFHLTYAAMLGWSPIARWFFSRQRYSNPRLREVEDSGRAKVIEEAVAAICFEYAREERFLEGVHHLDFGLLQTVRNMTSRLEVRVRTIREWEQAILRSFEIWRDLRSHEGGSVRMNLPDRKIDFVPPVDTTDTC